MEWLASPLLPRPRWQLPLLHRGGPQFPALPVFICPEALEGQAHVRTICKNSDRKELREGDGGSAMNATREASPASATLAAACDLCLQSSTRSRQPPVCAAHCFPSVQTAIRALTKGWATLEAPPWGSCPAPPARERP